MFSFPNHQVHDDERLENHLYLPSTSVQSPFIQNDIPSSVNPLTECSTLETPLQCRLLPNASQRVCARHILISEQLTIACQLCRAENPIHRSLLYLPHSFSLLLPAIFCAIIWLGQWVQRMDASVACPVEVESGGMWMGYTNFDFCSALSNISQALVHHSMCSR